MSRTQSLTTRWLGVGLAAILAVVTLGLALTDRLGLYINPDSAWFAVGMAVLVLVGTIASFALPLGAEADHGHDHGDHHPVVDSRSLSEPQARRNATSAQDASAFRLRHPADASAQRPESAAKALTPGSALVASGGVLASGVVVLTLVLPPTSLSAELAMSRDLGAPPLFAGADVVALATTGDTSQFGVGEWATVFATSTSPDAFEGEPVELTGFVTPGDDGFQLSRLVVTHCVIDAQPAGIPVASGGSAPETGQWVTVTGQIRSGSDGSLVVDAAEVTPIDEPRDPYEY